LTAANAAPYDHVAGVCKAPASEVSFVKHVPTWLIAPLALAGCAAAGSTRPAVTATADTEQESVVARLTRGSEEQERRISELEARLALLEQEAHEWREGASEKHAETVRIGAHRPDPVVESEEQRLPVAVVRLHEPESAPAALAVAPLFTSSKLPIVPLPEQRASKMPGAEGGTEPSAREAYRAALRFVSERRWDLAEAALGRFLQQYPDGPLSASAIYWRGEVYYGQRRYGDALQDFQAALSRFPEGGKAADALLKVGMCHLRLGDQAMAQRYFKQVREQYPGSDAARMAGREGSS
jgi:tol-pal system protein YbgF